MRSLLLPAVWAVVCVCAAAQSGTAITVAGRVWGFPLGPMPRMDTPLAAPNGLAVGPDGTLYVADQTAGVVVAVRNGIAQRVAGSGATGYMGDGGPAIEAALNGPGPLAVGRDGSLYIADLWNYAIRRVAPNGTITTIAGNGTSGACADGARATGACVSSTGGLAVDSEGNVYFSDSQSTVFRVQAGAGTISAYVKAQKLSYPESLAIDGADNLYILQNLNAGVLKVAPDGTVTYPLSGSNTPAAMTSIAVTPDGTLYATYNICHVLKAVGAQTTDIGSACLESNGFGIDQRAVAADGSGHVWVADDATQTVRQIDSGGVMSTFAGNNKWYYSDDAAPANTVALGGSISDFLVQPTGDILIASGGRIRRMATDGTLTTVVPFGAYDPAGLVQAPDGTVLFADTLNCRIQRLDASGAVSLFAGRGVCTDDGDGADAAQAGLSYPRSLVFDSLGRLYVATAGGVRRIDTLHVITTYAGSPAYSFQDNVPATQTSMDARALTFDASGDLLVSDFLSHTIRRVNAQGIITTVAGNGNFNTGADDGPALSHPVGLVWSMATDQKGTVWFSDGAYLRTLGTDGWIRTIPGSQWSCPTCLQNVAAVRVSGATVYAADWPVILQLAPGVHRRPNARPCAQGCGVVR